ncbi:MAG: sigma-70 family RNA polymerase sigma factor [Saprospiraceae bacterium]
MAFNTANISDEQILTLLQNGSHTDVERGLRLMMDKYQERLYWSIRKMVMSHDDANDILQNCFIKAYRNIDSFERKAKLFTWLYRIGINESITFLNKKKKEATASLDDGESGLANNLKSDDYFDGDDAQKRLLKAIETLPEKQKVVFKLRYYDEMPYEEMSEILETSVGALKASFHHAVKKVEQELTAGG